MREYFLLLLSAFVSCGQSNPEFKLQNSFLINPQKSVCINTKDCFCFSADSSLHHLIMYYSNTECEKKKLIDTVDFSPYKSTLHCFQSQNDDAYVVLWETEYEYYPLINAYFIAEGKLVKIGALPISLPCQSCESFEYPIKKIQVLQKGKEIEISFLEDVNFKPKNAAGWQLYKAGVLKFLFNTETNGFRYITSQD